MKHFLLGFIAFGIFSCNSGLQEYRRESQTTVEGALKEMWKNYIYWAEFDQSTDTRVFWAKHKDEILNNLVVADKYVSSKGDMCLVLYRTSVGDMMKKDSQWFRKLDGEWVVSSAYIAQYGDDPLHDGKGEEVNKWIKKASTWSDEESPDVWW